MHLCSHDISDNVLESYRNFVNQCAIYQIDKFSYPSAAHLNIVICAISVTSPVYGL
jgi:hypothetical protein